MGDAGDLVVVLTTLGDVGAAERLVQRLVEERRIACGNLIPGLTSIYRWKGEVAREGEVLVLMKTARSRLESLFARIGELHPYEVPEIVALSVEEVARAYCGWVIAETTQESA